MRNTPFRFPPHLDCTAYTFIWHHPILPDKMMLQEKYSFSKIVRRNLPTEIEMNSWGEIGSDEATCTRKRSIIHMREICQCVDIFRQSRSVFCCFRLTLKTFSNQLSDLPEKEFYMNIWNIRLGWPFKSYAIYKILNAVTLSLALSWNYEKSWNCRRLQEYYRYWF